MDFTRKRFGKLLDGPGHPGQGAQNQEIRTGKNRRIILKYFVKIAKVINYCSQNRIHSVNFGEIRNSPLFKNDKISRKASAQLIQAIFDTLEKKSNFAYFDGNREAGILSEKPFSQLARDIYDWANASGNIGQVCTFYELSEGNDTGN